MTIRYTARFKNAVWTEIGERVAKDGPAQPFFEMVLRRIGDSAWPAAGAIPPR